MLITSWSAKEKWGHVENELPTTIHYFYHEVAACIVLDQKKNNAFCCELHFSARQGSRASVDAPPGMVNIVTRPVGTPPGGLPPRMNDLWPAQTSQ